MSGLTLTGGPRRVLANMSWSAAEQMIRLGVGFLVSVTLARHLGPREFGTYTFIQSVIAMASTLMPLAADQIVQARMLTEPDCANTIFAASARLRIFGWLLASTIAMALISAIKAGDPIWLAAVTIAIIALAAQALDLIVVWFQSHLDMRSVFLARTPAFLLISAARGALVVGGAALATLAWTIAADSVLTALGLLIAWRASISPGSVAASTPRRFAATPLRSFAATPADMRSLLAESWPVFISIALAGIYYRLDAVMLSQLVGDAELGIYAVAAKISELWNVVSLVALGSLTPLLIRARTNDRDRFEWLLAVIYGGFAALGVAISLALCLLATPLCVLLFGPRYEPSGAVLAIHAWSCLPVFLFMASNCALVVEGAGPVVMLRTLVALIVNIALNLALIPSFGAAGAALANVAAYTLAVAAPLLVPSARPHMASLISALSARGLLETAAKARAMSLQRRA